MYTPFSPTEILLYTPFNPKKINIHFFCLDSRTVNWYDLKDVSAKTLKTKQSTGEAGQRRPPYNSAFYSWSNNNTAQVYNLINRLEKKDNCICTFKHLTLPHRTVWIVCKMLIYFLRENSQYLVTLIFNV